MATAVPLDLTTTEVPDQGGFQVYQIFLVGLGGVFLIIFFCLCRNHLRKKAQQKEKAKKKEEDKKIEEAKKKEQAKKKDQAKKKTAAKAKQRQEESKLKEEQEKQKQQTTKDNGVSKSSVTNAAAPVKVHITSSESETDTNRSNQPTGVMINVDPYRLPDNRLPPIQQTTGLALLAPPSYDSVMSRHSNLSDKTMYTPLGPNASTLYSETPLSAYDLQYTGPTTSQVPGVDHSYPGYQEYVPYDVPYPANYTEPKLQ